MRTRRSLLNFATTLVYIVVVTAVGLFASPWLEWWLGAGAFGGYRVLMDLSGYLGLLEFGLSGAMAPLVARALGREDRAELSRVLTVAVRSYVRVAVLMAAAGLAAVIVVPWFAAGLSSSGVADLRRAWLVLLLAPAPLALAPFRTIIEARQQGYAINLGLVAQSLLITGTALALARAGWGITGQSVANVAGIWALSLAIAAVVIRREPGLARALRWSEPGDAETRRALWSLSAPAVVLSLCGRLGLLADNLVIGGLLNVGAVTTLYFTQRLATLAQTLLQGVGNATWAALAELHARGEHATFNRRLVELTGVVGVLSAAALGPIVAYNRHFFALWSPRNVPYGGDLVIAVAAVNAMLQAETSLWGWCLNGTGHQRRQVPMAVSWAALNLAASVPLTPRLGIIGPLLGTTCASVAVSLWGMPRLLQQTFGTPPGALARSALTPVAWGVPYSAALWWLATRHRPAGWLGLAAEMTAAGLGFLALSVVVIWDQADRARWRARLRDLRRKPTPAPTS